MSQSEDKYLESLRKRYAKARKKERGQILDEYVQTTGYHRKYAIVVLRRP
ncbi:MAG: transposase, partial [Chloroflexi bacterium]|nr:transposase [Chloroflexota bacterium]